jgi:hypothetical protein
MSCFVDSLTRSKNNLLFIVVVLMLIEYNQISSIESDN